MAAAAAAAAAQERTRAKLQALTLSLQAELQQQHALERQQQGGGGGGGDPESVAAPRLVRARPPETPGATAARVRAAVDRIEAEMRRAEAVLRGVAAIEQAGSDPSFAIRCPLFLSPACYRSDSSFAICCHQFSPPLIFPLSDPLRRCRASPLGGIRSILRNPFFSSVIICYCLS
jgi:hypothetical protein